MIVTTESAATDLHFPDAPPGEDLDPCTIHTYYFGLSIPEEALGVFVYLRGQPAFPLSQGGLTVFRGTDNRTLLDAEYHDYQMTMPWPTIAGSTVRSANGLEIRVIEPGRILQLRYSSPDGSVRLDVRQTAISPLVARTHVMPGEEDHHGATAWAPGGVEQFMQVSGDVVLHGRWHPVSCVAIRDRSWCQVRAETAGGAKRMPPVAWSPMYFGPDLALNLVSVEHPDSNPAWVGISELPENAPLHYSGWLYRDGNLHEVVAARRTVLDYHPDQFVGTRQRLEVTDDEGRTYSFTGEALALCPVPAWPNVQLHDAVFRWTDERGRHSHGTYQEVWHADYQQAMTRRRLHDGGLR